MLKDSIEINTSAENIFEWFANIQNNYNDWHPDHIIWKWTRGNSFMAGSTALIKEILHGKVHTLRAVITKVRQRELIEYKFLFPESLIVKKGSFKITSISSGCIFTATLSFRLEKLLSRLFNKQMESIKKHMKEESLNLKKIVESKVQDQK